MKRILTIGHSNHSLDAFLALVKGAGITAIADVRTTPRSRWTPHFDAESLKQSLLRHGIAYVGLGEHLGGRPTSQSLYKDGHADYVAMGRTPAVQAGIERVLDGAETYAVALMCSEKEPLDCHRCLLVSRLLAERGAEVAHVHADGTIEPHADLEERLLKVAGNQAGMFDDRQTVLDDAYEAQTAKVAYRPG